MRIAVCLACQPRTWKMCYKNIRMTFEQPGVTVDYFIHTWDEDGSEYRNIPYRKFDRETLYDDLNKSFFPKKIKIDSYLNMGLEGFDSQRYSICKSIQLKREYEEECGFRYDWVFYTRFDFCKFYNINVVGLEKMLHTRHRVDGRYTLYGGGDDHIIYSDDMNCYALQDFGYFGSSEDMDMFSNLYEDFNSVRKQSEEEGSVLKQFCAEDFIAFFFLNRNIEIKQGTDFWDPGAPVREPLSKLGLDLSTQEGLDTYSKILDKCGWYYTDHQISNIVRDSEKVLEQHN